MTTMRKIQLRTGKAGQRGFNLIEAAIVLGIVGLVVGGIWVAASSVYENQRMSRATQLVLLLAQNMRATLSNQNTGAAATDVTATVAGYVPADLRGTAPGTIIHPWSQAGAADVLVSTLTNAIMQPRGGFVISLVRLPRTACFDLISKNTGQARDIGLVAVLRNGANVASTDASSTGNPATPGEMIAAAAGCVEGATNAVHFKFNLAN